MSKTFWITPRVCLSVYAEVNYRSFGLYFFGYLFNLSIVGRTAEKQSLNLKYTDDLMDYPHD